MKAAFILLAITAVFYLHQVHGLSLPPPPKASPKYLLVEIEEFQTRKHPTQNPPRMAIVQGGPPLCACGTPRRRETRPDQATRPPKPPTKAHDLLPKGFEEADRDGDLKVSYAEGFELNLIGLIEAERICKGDKNENGYIDMDEFSGTPEIFALFDTNGDNKISRLEIKVYYITGSNKEHPAHKSIFTKLDTNGDGFIDLTEWPKYSKRSETIFGK